MDRSDPFFFRLKGATRDLIKRAGTLERAAEITGLSDTQLSRCQNNAHADIISLSAVLALEYDTGEPLITRIMAERLGLSVTPRVGDSDVASEARALLGSLAKEAGEAIATVATATADNVVTPNEADLIDREVAQLEVVTGRVRNFVAAVKAKAHKP